MISKINKSNHSIVSSSAVPISKQVSHKLGKIKAFFRNHFTIKGKEILHLGGTKLGSLDFQNTGKAMDKGYFYERVPVKTPNGEIFLYGKTLKPYVKKWMKETRNGTFTGTFQQFMEKSPDLNALAAEQVRYLSDAERDQTEVSIQCGYLCQSGLDSSNTLKKPLPEGTYAYVMVQSIDQQGNPQVKLYAALKGMTSKGKIQHSSFARGGSVISAGILEVSSLGKIASISNFSGHYRPTKKELLACLTFLKDNKYDLQQCYVQHFSHSILMGIAHITHIKILGAVLTRADKWLKKHSPL